MLRLALNVFLMFLGLVATVIVLGTSVSYGICIYLSAHKGKILSLITQALSSEWHDASDDLPMCDNDGFSEWVMDENNSRVRYHGISKTWTDSDMNEVSVGAWTDNLSLTLKNNEKNS